MAPTKSRRTERLVQCWGDSVRMITETELLYYETAMAIAVLETGNFSSRHMMKMHNEFGFQRNSRVFQKCIWKAYGEYASAQMVMAAYQAREYDICTRHGLTDERAFRRWIVKLYAEDPAYSVKLSTSLAEVNRI